jgi:hypothetical protein
MRKTEKVAFLRQHRHAGLQYRREGGTCFQLCMSEGDAWIDMMMHVSLWTCTGAE